MSSGDPSRPKAARPALAGFGEEGPPAVSEGEILEPSFREALAYWFKLGWINFGGPAGQIALMHRDLVDRRRWIDERRFLASLDVCMLLPGPEAQQLATHIGWRLHGVRGGLAAGACFVLPSVAILLALSWIYATWGNVAAVVAVLGGIKPIVVAIIVAALFRIARRSLRTPLHAGLAIAALVAIAWLAVPFPAIVAGAAVIGLVAGRLAPGLFAGPRHGAENGPTRVAAPPLPENPRRRSATLPLLAAGVALWVLPAALLFAAGDTAGRLSEVYLFFTKAAFVTFGGAYAVLAYVAEHAVASGWLTREATIDGLALAETTPGPLIIVLQFVGFLAGWNEPGALSPVTAALVAALVTSWATFLPSTLLGLLTAPYAERLERLQAARAALGAVTAAVVGVIASLGLFLAREVFAPAAGGFDWIAVAAAAAAVIALLRLRVEAHWAIAGGALLGLLRLGFGI
jgi:chromate transporter